MNSSFRFLSLLLLTIILSNCKRELDWSVDPGPGLTPATNITADVTGRILDEYNKPLKGATVSAGTTTATTDVNGEFVLTNASLSDKRAFIKVDKAGYFQGSRTFIARQGNKHYVEVQLTPKTNVGSISGTGGGTINLGNGSAITLPANGTVVQSSGAAYTGSVQVAMTWIDPSSPNLYQQMPGDLRGIDASNTETGMQSYGMLGVELSGTGGEKLQIATGKKASLKFPIPSSMNGSAPTTIALWSFDETTGLWKQEGTATKSSNVYLAEVSHFSWWNCDIPFSTRAFISATLVDQNNQPLKGAHVIIKNANGQHTGAHGYTDSSGYFTGGVPAGQPLIMEVHNNYNCPGPVYTQNIGPYTANSNNNLGNITITITGLSAITVSGTAVDCSNAPLTNGYIEILNNFRVYRKAITNGSFSVTFQNCTPTANISYYIVDESASQQSSATAATVNAGNNSLGSISACGVSTQRFINYTVNGVAYSLTAPPDSIMGGNASQGSTLLMTGVNGFSLSPAQNISFAFGGNTVGTHPMSYLSITTPTFSDSTGVPNAAAVTVTEYGSVGGYIAGSFGGSFTGTGGIVHTVQCTFRIRRQY